MFISLVRFFSLAVQNYKFFCEAGISFAHFCIMVWQNVFSRCLKPLKPHVKEKITFKASLFEINL